MPHAFENSRSRLWKLAGSRRRSTILKGDLQNIPFILKGCEIKSYKKTMCVGDYFGGEIKVWWIYYLAFICIWDHIFEKILRFETLYEYNFHTACGVNYTIILSNSLKVVKKIVVNFCVVFEGYGAVLLWRSYRRNSTYITANFIRYDFIDTIIRVINYCVAQSETILELRVEFTWENSKRYSKSKGIFND